jgi:hypothetical protein
MSAGVASDAPSRVGGAGPAGCPGGDPGASQGGITVNGIEATESWFSRLVKKEVEYADPYEDRGLSIGIVVIGILVGSYFIVHQARSTAFLTAAFGSLEIVLLYGTLLFWIATSALIIVGQKSRSRDLDLGGLFFATAALAWLLAVFPFDFAHLADVAPDSLRFLVQWISNDVARALMVLGFIVHLGLAVFSAVLRLSVYRTRAQRGRADYDPRKACSMPSRMRSRPNSNSSP